MFHTNQLSINSIQFIAASDSKSLVIHMNNRKLDNNYMSSRSMRTVHSFESIQMKSNGLYQSNELTGRDVWHFVLECAHRLILFHHYIKFLDDHYTMPVHCVSLTAKCLSLSLTLSSSEEAFFVCFETVQVFAQLLIVNGLIERLPQLISLNRPAAQFKSIKITIFCSPKYGFSLDVFHHI